MLLLLKTAIPKLGLHYWGNATIIGFAQSGRGAARLARLHGVQEVGGSNPLAPTAVRQNVLPGGRFLFNYFFYPSARGFLRIIQG
jgi:hypothetical protein